MVLLTAHRADLNWKLCHDSAFSQRETGRDFGFDTCIVTALVVCRYCVCVYFSPECGASPVERIHPLEMITRGSVLCWMWC